MTRPRNPLEVNDVNSEISVPHWGITLRTLFGAALQSQQNPVPGERRQYAVRLNGAQIATIYVQQHEDLVI